MPGHESIESLQRLLFLVRGNIKSRQQEIGHPKIRI
jgi:hypothetical protein